MEQIAVSSSVLALRADKPLTPAMLSAIWEISAVLDEQHIPATVPNAVWLEIPSARLRGADARSDNIWLVECLRRLTKVELGGEHQAGEWGAVLVAEWHRIAGGSMIRLLIPPAAVHAALSRHLRQNRDRSRSPPAAPCPPPLWSFGGSQAPARTLCAMEPGRAAGLARGR
jgi:hypothetical protein